MSAHPEQAKLDHIIGFSHLEMFGHLFQVHPIVESKLREAEQCSSRILRLAVDSILAGLEQEATSVVYNTILLSEHEQSFAAVFRPASRFWSIYYSRMPRTQVVYKAEVEQESGDLYRFRKKVDALLGAFYIGLDAMYHASGRSGVEYELLIQSLKSYLAASVHHVIADATDAEREYQTALKLIGPMSVRKYHSQVSGHLQELIQQAPDKIH